MVFCIVHLGRSKWWNICREAFGNPPFIYISNVALSNTVLCMKWIWNYVTNKNWFFTVVWQLPHFPAKALMKNSYVFIWNMGRLYSKHAHGYTEIKFNFMPNLVHEKSVPLGCTAYKKSGLITESLVWMLCHVLCRQLGVLGTWGYDDCLGNSLLFLLLYAK